MTTVDKIITNVHEGAVFEEHKTTRQCLEQSISSLRGRKVKIKDHSNLANLGEIECAHLDESGFVEITFSVTDELKNIIGECVCEEVEAHFQVIKKSKIGTPGVGQLDHIMFTDVFLVLGKEDLRRLAPTRPGQVHVTDEDGKKKITLL